MKKLEIEKSKPTFNISVLKVGIIKVGLVFSISNFFISKTLLANNWRGKKIPSCFRGGLISESLNLYLEYYPKEKMLVIVLKIRAKVKNFLSHLYILNNKN